MKRFHIHVGVNDLEKSVQFFLTLNNTDLGVFDKGGTAWCASDDENSASNCC
jgi:hypothetical protein